MDRGHLKFLARKQLRQSYWPALLVCLIVIFFESISQGNSRIPFTLLGFITNSLPFRPGLQLLLLTLLLIVVMQIFVSNPIAVGKSYYFIREVEGTGQLKDLFLAFRSRLYWKITFIMFLYTLIIFGSIVAPLLIVITLIAIGANAALLFVALFIVIPWLCFGIMWSYRYRFISYFLAQNPNLYFRRSMYISKTLAEGIEFKLFLLEISFAGWYIIGSLLFGLGIFLVRPYHEATIAQAYKYQTETNERYEFEMIIEEKRVEIEDLETDNTEEVEDVENEKVECVEGGVNG